MREHLFVAAIAVVLATPRLWASSSTPFSLGDQGGIIVEVELDGQGPFRMLLDTGATHSAVTADVVEAIGAKVVAQSNVISPSGAVLRPIVAVNSLKIGPVTVDVVLPSVAPAGAFDKKRSIKGLIGQDVLAGLRYTIDFKRRIIEWHTPTSSDSRGQVLRLSFEHGRYLVALPQGEETLRLVPDSGAGGVVLFESRCRQRVDTIDTGEMVELFTAEGRRPARVVRVPALRVGDRTMRNVRAVTIGGDDLHPASGDGLLPLHLFERVTFDGPGKRLILDMMFF